MEDSCGMYKDITTVCIDLHTFFGSMPKDMMVSKKDESL
jgi:hypothetical protein